MYLFYVYEALKTTAAPVYPTEPSLNNNYSMTRPVVYIAAIWTFFGLITGR